jgi:hypothetical protein
MIRMKIAMLMLPPMYAVILAVRNTWKHYILVEKPE